MNRRIVLIIIVLVGCGIINPGLSFAAEGRKGRVGGVRGMRLISRPIRPRLAKPIILRPVVLPPARLRPVAVSAVAAAPYVGPEIGLAGGLFAAIPSVAGEVRFHKLLGIEGTAVKVGLRFAEGKDSNEVNRKNALIFADGIINLNKGPGAIFYLGGGLNYLSYTTGQTSGTVGGEVYLGVQEGALYAEAGYGAIRTGFSPSYKGIDLNLGFKWAY